MTGGDTLRVEACASHDVPFDILRWFLALVMRGGDKNSLIHSLNTKSIKFFCCFSDDHTTSCWVTMAQSWVISDINQDIGQLSVHGDCQIE